MRKPCTSALQSWNLEMVKVDRLSWSVKMRPKSPHCLERLDIRSLRGINPFGWIRDWDHLGYHSSKETVV